MGTRSNRSTPGSPYLGLVENQSYTETVSVLRKQYPRFDEIEQGIGWVLARDPHHGDPVTGRPDYYVFKTVPGGQLPEFRVLYKYGPEEQAFGRILLIAIQPVLPAESEDPD